MLDAIVLAAAGLNRLGRIGEASQVLDTAVMLPAPGQGALAVECRSDDQATVALLSALEHAPTRTCVTAERALLSELEAGCSAPLGALARLAGDQISLEAVVGTASGETIRHHLHGDSALDLGYHRVAATSHQARRRSHPGGFCEQIRNRAWPGRATLPC